jgi:hypothetical protein
VLNQGVDLTTLGIVVGQDNFEIFQADTLGNLFGNNTLLGGSSSGIADNILTWSGIGWSTYYFNTDRGRWEESGNPTVDWTNRVLRPDEGMIIVHRGAAISIPLYGRAAPCDSLLRYSKSGSSYLGGFPFAQTLLDSKIQELPDWQKSGDPATADQVQVFSGGIWISYFFNSAAAVPQWQQVGTNTPANSVNIFTPGRPVMFLKRGTAAGSAFYRQARPAGL